MKKQYIEPITKIVAVRCQAVLQSLSGDGLNLTITNSHQSGVAAEGRRGGSLWSDDGEEDY